MKVVVHLLSHLGLGVIKDVQQQVRTSHDRNDVALLHPRQDTDQVGHAMFASAVHEIGLLIGPFLGTHESQPDTSWPEDPTIGEIAQGFEEP